MDSKLRKLIIVAITFSILAIISVIVLVNFNTIRRSTNHLFDQTVTTQATVSGNEDLSAFLQDETFFDKEDTSADLSESGQKLDMLVTSVEKDLRIKIVNTLGVPVAGQEFNVDVNDTQYTDQDKDGMIYIGDMEAGEYYVGMEPADGYRIPNSKIKVAVKDKVEYSLIDDISYYVKSEDEVDASIEDTEENGAKEDADGTERTSPVISEESQFGIDVSKWNKEIDWAKVKDAGVQYAIIRCGYRGASTGSLVEDPYFAANIQGATEAGIKVGLYFFTQATTEVEAVEEASMAIMLCNEYRLEYPIFIDTEGAGGNGRADALDKETRTAVCEAFCETIENAGYTSGVYASKNWFEKYIDAGRLDKYVVWLAEYKSAPTYEGDFQVWQYTSKGSVEGIDGKVDMNISLLTVK